MGLTDRWVAIPADDEARRTFASVDLDERGWEPVEVPGHWRSSAAFADCDGPLLYRAHFDAAPPPVGTRRFLRFDGIFYQGDVWLDGAYLGDTEGYFQPHVFEVTEPLRERRDHVLAVEVTCAAQRDRTAKRNITGTFQHAAYIDPDWNPGGIWRPVVVEETGPVRISRLSTSCIRADADRAVLGFTADLDALEPGTVRVRSTVGGVDHDAEHELAAGANTVEWVVTVDRPALWWPRALGDAELHTVSVEVRLAESAGGQVSDRRRLRTGLRQVSVRHGIWSVNGERLFVKGTRFGPTRPDLATADAAAAVADVVAARDLGFDLIRMHAHVGAAATYDAADECGMLVWQDFPLHRGYARSIRKQAVAQARDMVDVLGHHPSVALWCAHDDPSTTDVPVEALADPSRRRRAVLGYAVGQEVPTWNRAVLDRAVARSLERHDPTRPVMRHSGVPPQPPLLAAEDSHLAFGWHWGDPQGLVDLARKLPAQVRFPTLFGAQSVPESAGFVEPGRWPDLDWDRIEAHHGLDLDTLDRRVGRDGRSFGSWQTATQDYQAAVLRRHIEELRRLKYHPTGGFCQVLFADAQPAVSAALLDHGRRPRAAARAVAEACRPVIVVADRPPDEVHPGEALELAVHVVSDHRIERSGTVHARFSWDGGSTSWEFAGDVAADSVVLVGTVSIAVPEAPGPGRLELWGRIGDDDVTNRYDLEIVS